MDTLLPRSRTSARLLFILANILAAGFMIGCGGMGNSTNQPPPGLHGNTQVLLLMSSTANDKLVEFVVAIGSVVLTDTAGNSVTLYNNPNVPHLVGGSGPGEWMHLNGAAEPLATVSVPQGTYTSATVKAGYCQFTVVTLSALGALEEDTYAEDTCGQQTGSTTVNLPSPIVISGPAMVLSLDLQVAQSYALTAKGTSTSLAVFTISPVFTLTPLVLSPQPTNELNGKMGPIVGQVTSVSSAESSFVAQTADLVSITVRSDDSTTYQGIAGFSSLAAGTLIDMDLAVQSDLSLLATRVEVQDAAAPAVFVGPMIIGPNSPYPGWFTIRELQEEACNDEGPPLCRGGIYQFNTSTVFKVSGQFTNLQALPFPASFSASNLFLGLNVSVSSSGQANSQGAESVTTVTLWPQTINGTVTATNSTGFAVYTVALAPDDPIPTLQQTGATNPLSNPATVTVYTDSNTQLLNSSPITAGSVLRFTGLIFDDNGTLRMDCGQILDGVPE